MLGFTAPPRPMSIEDMAPSSPPSLLSAPSLSGSFFAGQTLLCDTGLWAGDPVAYEYKWQKDGIDLGDTDNAYLITGADDGGLLTCLVRAQNAGGWSDWQQSNGLYALTLALWLDAADTASIVQAGSAVSQWNDKSGNTRNVAQASAAAQPRTGTRTVNGLNVIDGDGNDYLYGIRPFTSGNFVIFCVGGADGGTYDDLWSFANGGIRQEINNAGQFVFYGTNGGTTGGVDDTVLGSALTASIVSLRRSGTSLEARYNGTNTLAASGAPSLGTANFVILARNTTGGDSLNGWIGELVMGGRAWTAAEQNQVGNYMALKWGIGWALI